MEPTGPREARPDDKLHDIGGWGEPHPARTR